MGKTVQILGGLLLLTPSWLSIYFAVKPGYEPGLGMLLGLTAIFWGFATFIGWIILLSYYINRKLRWIFILVGTVLVFVINISSLVLMTFYEDVKRDNHFADNKQFLELIGDRILSHNISLNEANKLLEKNAILFTPKLLIEEGDCRAVFFFASGALDSQLGYYYQRPIIRQEQCRSLRFARRVSSKWAFGAL